MLYLGVIGSTGGVGVNNLIKAGAILTTNIEDILLHYPQFKDKRRIELDIKIKKEYEGIYNVLKEQDCFIEEISIKLGIEIVQLLQLITNMEIENIICQDIDGKYKLTERR